MKTVKINLYGFKELDEEAKENALFNHFNEYEEYRIPRTQMKGSTLTYRTPLDIYSRGDTKRVEGFLEKGSYDYLFTKDGLYCKREEK